jgi:Fic family protein
MARQQTCYNDYAYLAGKRHSPERNSIMDYVSLLRMKDRLKKNWDKLPQAALQSFLRSFDIEYTHNSTAIEGNTLTLIETKTVLEDNLSIGGKNLREIYEVTNHNKAFSYVKACAARQEPLSESTVKNIHAILMENIITGGIYRNCEVRITGAGHKPPARNEMYMQIKEFFSRLPNHPELNPIELAAYTHAEFVRIHPFEDGNGRTARLIMNDQLMINGFLPISIRKEDRLQYFESLEKYAVENDLRPFADRIADLEEKQIREYLTLLPGEEDLNS